MLFTFPINYFFLLYDYQSSANNSPIIGGYLNQGLGWRSTFWFLAIFAFCIWFGILLILPETWRPEEKKIEDTKNHNDGKQDDHLKAINKHKKINFSALLGPLQLFHFPNITLAVSFVGIL